MLIDITTKAQKEVYEVGLMFKKIMVSGKAALADGWQPGQDIPKVMLESSGEMMVAIQGMDKIPAEIKENPHAAIRGALVPVSEGLEEAMAAAPVA